MTETIHQIDVFDWSNFSDSGDLSTLISSKGYYGSIFDHQGFEFVSVSSHMSRASAINVPFFILGCFETNLQESDKLRYPTFIGSSVISSQSPWSSVGLDLGLMINLCL